MGMYEEELAAGKRARHGVWGCTCGTDNPRHYDACTGCQRPSWTCAACGTVNPQRSTCTECGGETPAELLGDEGEPTYAEWCALQVGPRRVGGTYEAGYDGSRYEVLGIEHGPRPLGQWPTWDITVRGTDGRVRTHCTGWDPRRDRIIAQPLPTGDRSVDGEPQ
ncbi:hypothetical protein ACIP93_32915 [Streptomyces sp. NPDC088745]|uniref:hypothetical protein n=1 Tax=Streptomyces sp. NPDC088745 TaxID=3365884 RepID=UPI00382EF1AC